MTGSGSRAQRRGCRLLSWNVCEDTATDTLLCELLGETQPIVYVYGWVTVREGVAGSKYALWSSIPTPQSQRYRVRGKEEC